MSKVFCVIPAFNEEKNIKRVIRDVKPFVDIIVVVDDCSSDDTVNIAQAERVVVLRHLINRGQGAALQTGNRYALDRGADIVVHFDADGQFDAKEIKDIIDPIIKNESDLVFGSRFLNKKSNMPLFKKYIIMPIGRIVNKLFFGLNFTDPQNGFRALNKKALQKINIHNDGSAHCSEILAKAVKYKFRLKEVPVTVHYSDFGQGLLGGKGRGKGGFRIIKDLILEKILN